MILDISHDILFCRHEAHVHKFVFSTFLQCRVKLVQGYVDIPVVLKISMKGCYTTFNYQSVKCK